MTTEHKFKVGDVLIGNELNQYSITNAVTRVKVIRLLNSRSTYGEAEVRVRAIEGNYIGGEFEVGERYFMYYEEPATIGSKEYELAFSEMLEEA